LIVQQDLLELYNNLQAPPDAGLDFMGQLKQTIHSAVYTTSLLLKEINSNPDAEAQTMMQVKGFYKLLEHFMISAYEKQAKTDDPELREKAKQLFGNFTMVTFLLKQKMPCFTCLEQVYKHSINYIHKVMPIHDGGEGVNEDVLGLPWFLLDQNVLKAMKLSTGKNDIETLVKAVMCSVHSGESFVLNSCFRRLATMADGHGEETELTPEDVCPTLVMKKFALQKGSSIGLGDLHKFSKGLCKSTMCL